MKKPPRVRRPSLREVEKQAGRPVVSFTYAADGARVFTFGKQEAEPQAQDGEPDDAVALFKARSVPKMKVVL